MLRSKTQLKKVKKTQRKKKKMMKGQVPGGTHMNPLYKLRTKDLTVTYVHYTKGTNALLVPVEGLKLTEKLVNTTTPESV